MTIFSIMRSKCWPNLQRSALIAYPFRKSPQKLPNSSKTDLMSGTNKMHPKCWPIKTKRSTSWPIKCQVLHITMYCWHRQMHSTIWFLSQAKRKTVVNKVRSQRTRMRNFSMILLLFVFNFKLRKLTSHSHTILVLKRYRLNDLQLVQWR